MKTRAGYVKAPWQADLRDVDLPDAAPPGEVLVRVEACGLCGTDLHIAEVEARDWQPFGHEVAGVIESVGPGAPHLAVGQRVVLETSSYCGHCELCRNRRADLCRAAPGFWGRPAMGFADRMLVPACCVVPYADLAPDVACLAEPLGVAIDLVRTADIQLGDRVAVIGPGPIALMALPLIARRGALRTVCMGRAHSVQRLSAAQKLGAEALALDAPLADRTDLHRQFDRVLVTAPVTEIPPALALLAYGGVLTFLGVTPGDSPISFDANDFHFRKLQLRASFASPAMDFPLALQILRSGVVPGAALISHRFALAELSAALRTARDDKARTIKIVVHP